MNSYSDIFHKIGYNIDASHLQQFNTVEVFLPNTREELIEVVENSVKEGKHIVCRGGGTNLVGSCLPREDTIVIDISRLNKIVSLGEDYVVVESGITNDDLNDVLIKKEKFFPVVLGSHAAAEIGGMIATNGAGMRAIKYGKMENWVVELDVLYVDKEKKIQIKKLVGNECSEFLGAEGDFGIVLQAKLKTIGLLKGGSMDFKSFSTVHDALTFVNEMKGKYDGEISALELINPQVSELLGFDKKYYILVEFENKNIGGIKDEGEMKKIWERRDACYSVTINAGYDQIEDPEVHDHFEEFFEWFEEKQIPIFGHIGIGVLHPHFKAEQKEFMEEMYNFVQKLGGKVSGEHGIGKKKQKYLGENEKKRILQLKEKWDINDIFGF